MPSNAPEHVTVWEYLKARLARLWPGLPQAWAWPPDAWERWEEALRRGESAPKEGPWMPSAEPQPDAHRQEDDAPPHPRSESWSRPGGAFPWRAVLALGLALWAQALLLPPRRAWLPGLVFYGLALLLWGLHLFREHQTSPHRPFEARSPSFVVRPGYLVVGVPMATAAFFLFGGNRYTGLNLVLWVGSLLSVGLAFWPRSITDILRDGYRIFRRGSWRVTITPTVFALLLALGVALFFRGYRLAQVPPEMFSDHAEKLYDVMDVLDGQWRIFFPRNTGREDFQMYLTALMARLFGTGISFMSLKLGTFFLGLFMLPYLYLLGREMGHPWGGVFAMLLAGMAYWPNVQARVALRFILYPAFVAPTLYHLLRALRAFRPRDFILAGVFLGLGLHGYAPFRMVPLTVMLAVGMALASVPPKRRAYVLQGFTLLVVFSFLVFLPLFRYMLDHPQMFFYRGMTRLGQMERPYPDHPLKIFLQETWQALIMPWWDNGSIWVHSVPGHPALALVSAALLALGYVWALVGFARTRDWRWLFLVLSVPLLMLPSILSLAFPEENPSLNRSAGALVPIFLLAGLALEVWVRSLWTWAASRTGRRLLVGAFLAALLALEARHNYDLVFRRYAEEFRLSAWNTSELGAVIGGFARSVGAPDRAWVIPYPHWVDTRLVGIRAGFPRRDYALPRDRLEDTLALSGPKLFLFRPEDQETENRLWELYPQGRLWRYRSSTPGKDFLVFFVP